MKNTAFYCENCGDCFPEDHEFSYIGHPGDFPQFWNDPTASDTAFCPTCGARDSIEDYENIPVIDDTIRAARAAFNEKVPGFVRFDPEESW